METAPGHVPEPRTAMMAIARVVWKDSEGTVQTETARIEDMSVSGACIRLKVPIEPGVEIHVAWCRGQFSATTKYCRRKDFEYVVGMQRNTAPGVVSAPAKSSFRIAPSESCLPTPSKIRAVPAPRKVHSKDSPIFIRPPEPLPLVPVTFPPPAIEWPVIGFEIASRNSPRAQARESFPAPRAMFQNKTSSLLEERTGMQTKWLNIGSKRASQEAPKENHFGALPPRIGSSAGAAAANLPSSLGGETNLATLQGDLLPLEDIYRSAGIVVPRLGYSINKVVDMLNSDHLRGLPAESKRASLMMALDAAGIPLDAILQDATQRQSAIASCESAQRRKFEEYWSRKAEENSLLQAEMEHVARQYVERMNRNLNEVAQEKEAFQKWQANLQRETDQISEAVGICAKPAAALDASAASSESAPEPASRQPASGAPPSATASSATTSSATGSSPSSSASPVKSGLVAKSA